MATTKKPTTKNLHYGGDSGFPPRGRRGFGGDPRRNPRRRPQVEPRRRGDDRPRAPGIDRPQMPRGRNPRIMTPAMRRRLMELRRRAQQRRQLPPQQPRGRATPYTSSVGRQTPAQQKAARDKFNKMMEANKRMRANVFGRGRKPTQATQTPKNVLDRFANSRDRFNKRKRPTAMPEPQLVPQQRRYRPAIPEPIQAIPEPMQRPRGRRVAAKGGVITKKNIGANDFRKGGYVLSTVDNRKNKK